MKKICIILAAMLLCLAMTAYAETAEAPSLIGVTDGDTYENAFFGVGCTLEGWHYSSMEEIAQLNQVAADNLGEKAAELVEQAGALITMLAKSPTGMQNITFQAQDATQLRDSIDIYGLTVTIGSSLSLYKSQLEEAGFSDVQCSLGTAKIGGKDFPVLYGQYIIQGIQAWYKQIWMVEGNYMASFTITSALSDDTDAILSNFYLLEQAEQPAA